MDKSIKIVEVGPRDGLQNEALFVPTATKLELINRLSDAGLRTIETTSFVSPKWVKQMADHVDIMTRLDRRPGMSYPVLIPNMQGFEAALACGVQEIAVFTAASETFSKTNINCSINASFQRFAPIFSAARQHGIKVRGYVSCVVGCPYEGAVPPLQVAEVAERLYQSGCYEISLGDTIGTGNPDNIEYMLDAVAHRIPISALAGHYHDTYGTALLNIHTSYRFGLRVFDSAISGLGGCPYAKGTSGNVATEDVVYLMNSIGAETGIDLNKLIEVSTWISRELKRQPASKVQNALARSNSTPTTQHSNPCGSQP